MKSGYLLSAVAMAMFLSMEALPGNAQDNEETANTPAIENYTLERDGESFIRFNKNTGETSICTVVNNQLSCRLAADERDSLLSEIARLEERIAALEKSGADDQAKTDTPEAKKETKPQSETKLDQEFDKAMDYATRAMRRFFDVMKDLRREMENDPSANGEKKG